ncbi:MAG TPA: preprotein translocase subunit SecA [Patescibacteria group bacterium]|nr:preprotein translocase subunit SecA [Patescibacteria group bacterium]
MSILQKITKIFGDPNEKELEKLQPQVEAINALEEKYKKLTQREIKERSGDLRKKIQSGKKTKDEVLPQAFALAREASKRTLNQRHYDVQLMGGIVLHQGKIAEMKTGEGKTLTSTAPIFLNALEGKGVHVITVNDYLAKRDTVWMGQIYQALGISISCIVQNKAFIYDPEYVDNVRDKDKEEIDKKRDELGNFKVEEAYLRPISRKQAYQADITYGTNNQFGFDYLRDNLVYSKEQRVQRGHSFAIIDEIDSILIDEARTPLIISSPAQKSDELYYKLAHLVKTLSPEKDYIVDEKTRSVSLTEKGSDKLANALGEDPWQKNNIELVHHIEAALKAKALFQKDRDYIVKAGEVVIVDKFTGRLMPGRRYSEGVHQAIEAKENVDIKKESRTMATISFQNYFRFYDKLSGMTGTAATEAEEFHKIYDLEVVIVPTNRPLVRKKLSDKVYRTEKAKYRAIVEDVKKRHKKGQPILIGTGGFSVGEKTVGAIEKNRIIKEMLSRAGLTCKVLDATNHEKEGQIIAQAGKLGAITVATNMAGRGVDIVLGGNPPEKKEQEKVKNLGGLHVIGTERHEARRIDNQLRGRSGRQGDPGSSQFFVSLEDDLMKIFGGSRVSSIMKTLNIPEDQPIESKIVSNSIASAQKKVEGYNFDTRKHLLEYDNVLNKHREAIYSKRRKVLDMSEKEVQQEILKIIGKEIENIVNSHIKSQEFGGVNSKELIETMENLLPLSDDIKKEIKVILQKKENLVNIRKKIINFLKDFSNEKLLELKEKLNDSGKDLDLDNNKVFSLVMRRLILKSIDNYWIDHLQVIENLKGGIGLRAYGQEDPLVEYKRESYKKFSQLLDAVNKQISFSVFKLGVAKDAIKKPKRELNIKGSQKSSSLKDKSAIGQVVDNKKRIGRNDPCPCGSGKKYKKCCYPKYE